MIPAAPALTAAEIGKLHAEIVMAAWDAVPASLRGPAGKALEDRGAARAVFAGQAGPVRDLLFAHDVADDFARLAAGGRYTLRQAELLAVMETRVRWARIARDARRLAGDRGAA